jgi:hypothetical protein
VRSNHSVEAGAGRPFRFSLVLEAGRGRLLFWLGGAWAAVFGVFTLAVFTALGAVLAVLPGEGAVPAGALVAGSAAAGALFVAIYLRPRAVLFEKRAGTWCWRQRGSLARGWAAITEERPLRIEREVLSTVENWTLYAGPVRLFSYLGDPSIGRSVTAAFRTAGVPLHTEMKRAAPGG